MAFPNFPKAGRDSGLREVLSQMIQQKSAGSKRSHSHEEEGSQRGKHMEAVRKPKSAKRQHTIKRSSQNCRSGRALKVEGAPRQPEQQHEWGRKRQAQQPTCQTVGLAKPKGDRSRKAQGKQDWNRGEEVYLHQRSDIAAQTITVSRNSEDTHGFQQ